MQIQNFKIKRHVSNMLNNSKFDTNFSEMIFTSGKRVNVKSVSGVRIPLSPQKKESEKHRSFLCLKGFQSILSKILMRNTVIKTLFIIEQK